MITQPLTCCADTCPASGRAPADPLSRSAPHRDMLAADAGANLRELMDRLGHSTSRAAMVYLHGSNERQQAIADELTKQAAVLLGRSKAKPSGTQRARRRGTAS
jgi:hypothetical protein